MEIKIDPYNRDEWSEESEALVDFWIKKSTEHCTSSPETKKGLKKIQKQMENHVTKDLFEAKIDGLAKLINEKFEANGKEHGSLDKRVATTNGRVKRLEIWRAMLIGAWAVITVMFPVLFVYFLNTFKTDVNNQITHAIDVNNNRFFEIE